MPALGIFIASAQELTAVVGGINGVLDHDYRHRFRVSEWPASFSAGQTPVLPTLVNAIERADFGIFVALPTDVTKMEFLPDRETRTPRDNVIFELGLFIGMHGPERVYCLYPDVKATDRLEYWLPTDFRQTLAGMALDTRRIEEARDIDDEPERQSEMKSAVSAATKAAVAHFDATTQSLFRASRKKLEHPPEQKVDAPSMWGRRFQRLSPDDLTQGEVVLHPLFGLGTVVESQDVGGISYVLMDFDDGQRRIPSSDDLFHPRRHPGDA